jgi:DNA polymerase I
MEKLKVMKAEGSGSWKELSAIEGSTEREGMNFPIQAGGAICMKDSLIAIREHIIKHNYDAYLVCTVHDQVDLEVRDDIAQKLHDEICQIMIESGNKYVKLVKMEVDGSITKVWSK